MYFKFPIYHKSVSIQNRQLHMGLKNSELQLRIVNNPSDIFALKNQLSHLIKEMH